MGNITHYSILFTHAADGSAAVSAAAAAVASVSVCPRCSAVFFTGTSKHVWLIERILVTSACACATIHAASSGSGTAAAAAAPLPLPLAAASVGSAPTTRAVAPSRCGCIVTHTQ